MDTGRIRVEHESTLKFLDGLVVHMGIAIGDPKKNMQIAPFTGGHGHSLKNGSRFLLLLPPEMTTRQGITGFRISAKSKRTLQGSDRRAIVLLFDSVCFL